MSTSGMLWLTQLGEHSPYLALMGPLVVFGTGNGLAFVPLTTTALDGVKPEDSGAASGLVNVMQQVGGALGLSILVTVAHLPTAATSLQSYRHDFVIGADHAFWASTLFLLATLGLIIFAIRPKPTAPYEPGTLADAELVDELALEM